MTGWPENTKEYRLSNHMKVVIEEFPDRREVSLFNEAGDIIGDAESGEGSDRLRNALRDIALNCEAGNNGFSTSRSWAAVGKLARDALAQPKE